MDFRKERLNITRVSYKSRGSLLEGLIFGPNKSGKSRGSGVVFIHGHESSAWDSSSLGYLLRAEGFAAFLPSQMGYGLSEGSSDYCGPKTVQGILDGIRFFRKQHFVNSEKLGVWGISRGAVVASLIVTQEPKLFKVAVFQSGVYEMKLNFKTTKIQGIRDTIRREAGRSEKVFRERSSIYNMDELSCPVLILHGGNDERILPEQAKMLDKKLTQLGKEHKTIILKDQGHYLTKLTKDTYTIPFLKRYL